MRGYVEQYSVRAERDICFIPNIADDAKVYRCLSPET